MQQRRTTIEEKQVNILEESEKEINNKGTDNRHEQAGGNRESMTKELHKHKVSIEGNKGETTVAKQAILKGSVSSKRKAGKQQQG